MEYNLPCLFCQLLFLSLVPLAVLSQPNSPSPVTASANADGSAFNSSSAPVEQQSPRDTMATLNDTSVEAPSDTNLTLAAVEAVAVLANNSAAMMTSNDTKGAIEAGAKKEGDERAETGQADVPEAPIEEVAMANLTGSTQQMDTLNASSTGEESNGTETGHGRLDDGQNPAQQQQGQPAPRASGLPPQSVVLQAMPPPPSSGGQGQQPAPGGGFTGYSTSSSPVNLNPLAQPIDDNQPSPVFFDPQACTSADCNGRGICLGSRGMPICLCNAGALGARCQSNACDPNEHCNGRGWCTGTAAQFVCFCNLGFNGAQCQYQTGRK